MITAKPTNAKTSKTRRTQAHEYTHTVKGHNARREKKDGEIVVKGRETRASESSTKLLVQWVGEERMDGFTQYRR